MYKDKFGYVPVSEPIDWNGGKIEPLPEFRDAVKWVESHVATDGYLYPPFVHSVEFRGNGSQHKVPQSERPAFLHQIPTSHAIELSDVSAEKVTIRKGIGGFVIHFAGFLFGHRCQFDDWWVDGRVSTKSESDFSIARLEDAAFCLQQAVETWSG